MSDYHAYCGACGGWSPSDQLSWLDHVMPPCPWCTADTILVAHTSVVKSMNRRLRA